MSKYFISYSTRDRSAAKALEKSLSRSGAKIYLDDNVLAAGADLSAQVEHQIESADTIIVLLSANSSGSRWVQHEVTTALAKGKNIVPVMLDDHAKENWIWPLVSDRPPIVRNPDESSAGFVKRTVDEIASIS